MRRLCQEGGAILRDGDHFVVIWQCPRCGTECESLQLDKIGAHGSEHDACGAIAPPEIYRLLRVSSRDAAQWSRESPRVPRTVHCSEVN